MRDDIKRIKLNKYFYKKSTNNLKDERVNYGNIVIVCSQSAYSSFERASIGYMRTSNASSFTMTRCRHTIGNKTLLKRVCVESEMNIFTFQLRCYKKLTLVCLQFRK